MHLFLATITHANEFCITFAQRASTTSVSEEHILARGKDAREGIFFPLPARDIEPTEARPPSKNVKFPSIIFERRISSACMSLLKAAAAVRLFFPSLSFSPSHSAPVILHKGEN